MGSGLRSSALLTRLFHCRSLRRSASTSKTSSGWRAIRVVVLTRTARSYSDEFAAVLVKELGQQARGSAGDPLEGVGRVVVLAGEGRPLPRDEQLGRLGGCPVGDEAIEELPLVRDPEADA